MRYGVEKTRAPWILFHLPMDDDQLMGPGVDNISAGLVAQQQAGALLLEHHDELRSAFAYLVSG